MKKLFLLAMLLLLQLPTLNAQENTPEVRAAMAALNKQWHELNAQENTPEVRAAKAALLEQVKAALLEQEKKLNAQENTPEVRAAKAALLEQLKNLNVLKNALGVEAAPAALDVQEVKGLELTEQNLVKRWTSDVGNLKIEVYRVGRKIYRKCILANEDYFVEQIEPTELDKEPGGYLLLCESRFTFNNVVREFKGGTLTLTFKSGDVYQKCDLGPNERKQFFYRKPSDKIDPNNTSIFIHNGEILYPLNFIHETIDNISVKVAEGKYKKYSSAKIPENTIVLDERFKVDKDLLRCAIEPFYYTYDMYESKLKPFVQHVRIKSGKTWDVITDQQLMHKTRDEWHKKYGVDIFQEMKSFANAPIDYIVAKVEAGAGAMVGLEGMTSKQLEKLVKKNKIDLNSVAQEYATMIDSIIESWKYKKERDVFVDFYCPVSENDSVVSATFLSRGENNAPKKYYKKVNGKLLVDSGEDHSEIVILHVKYKSGNEFYTALKKGANENTFIPGNIISKGVIKKQDGTLTIDLDLEDSHVFKYNNGDEFIPSSGGYSTRIARFDELPSMDEGTMYYANGNIEAVKGGMTQTMIKQKEEAEAKRKAQEEAQEKADWLAKRKAKAQEVAKKYGCPQFVNAFVNAQIKKGMPFNFVKEMCEFYGNLLKHSHTWDGDDSKYYIHSENIFRPGYYLSDPSWGVWFSNGKVSSFIKY